jgi:hypothetical protein
MMWWQQAALQTAIVAGYGWVVFRIGVAYGRDCEGREKRRLDPARVIQDKLNMAYIECKEAGKSDICDLMERRAKRRQTTWTVFRVFVNSEDQL